MDLEEVCARAEILDLISEHTLSNDRGEWDRMDRVWADDAVMKVPGVGVGRYEGRDAITSRFRSGAARKLRAQTSESEGKSPMSLSRHHVTSTRLSFVDASHAEGVSYLVITDAGYDHSGSYEDKFAKVDGRWVMVERKTQVEHVSADSHYGGFPRAAVASTRSGPSSVRP